MEKQDLERHYLLAVFMISYVKGKIYSEIIHWDLTRSLYLQAHLMLSLK